MNIWKNSALFLGLLLLGFLVIEGKSDTRDSAWDKISVVEIKVLNDDVTLYAKIAGNVKAENILIAINGGPGQSGRYMDSIDKLVGDNLALVTYDQRGTGQSSKPTSGYELLKYVEDLEAVREAVGAEQVHVLGHSWGGIITMRYATVHPNRVRSIILMGSGPPARQAAQEGQARLGQRMASLQKQGIIPETLPQDLESLMEAILPAYFSDPKFKIPAEIRETSFSQEVNQQTFSALGNWDFSQEVSQLTHPVLLLWGKDDPFGLPMVEAVKDSLFSAQITFVLLDGCGHYWQECPDTFFARIRTFLKLNGS